MSLILAEKEEAGPGLAPAAVIEELSPRVYGQQLSSELSITSSDIQCSVHAVLTLTSHHAEEIRD